MSHRSDIARAHFWELLAVASLVMLIRVGGEMWAFLFLFVLLLWSIDLIRRKDCSRSPGPQTRSGQKPNAA